MKVLPKRWMAPILASLSIAWLLAGSHCALFAATFAQQSKRSCCESKPQAPLHENCKDCCQTLTAPVPDSALGVTGFHPVCVATVITVAPAPVPSQENGVHLDSGASPPGQFFVNVVLGSSLNSQAPPVFVS